MSIQCFYGKVIFGCFVFFVMVALLTASGVLTKSEVRAGNDKNVVVYFLQGLSSLVALCVTPYGIWWAIRYGGTAARLSWSGVLGLIGVFGLGLMLLLGIAAIALG